MKYLISRNSIIYIIYIALDIFEVILNYNCICIVKDFINYELRTDAQRT